MSHYSPDEMETRLTLVRPIVEAAFGIRARVLSPDELEKQTRHWEAAFSRVPTPELRNLYRIGLAHKCVTAAEFQNVWDMQMESEAQATAHKNFLAKRAAEESKARPIPAHILEKWGMESNLKAAN